MERFELCALSSVMSVMLSHRIQKRKAAVFVGMKIYCRFKCNASTPPPKKRALKNCDQRLKLFSRRESLKKASIDKSLRRHEDIQQARIAKRALIDRNTARDASSQQGSSQKGPHRQKFGESCINSARKDAKKGPHREKFDQTCINSASKDAKKSPNRQKFGERCMNSASKDAKKGHYRQNYGGSQRVISSIEKTNRDECSQHAMIEYEKSDRCDQ